MQPNAEMSSGHVLARAKETAAYLGIAKIGNEEIEKLLLELTAECEFWQQRAIEERAKRIANVCESERIGVWSRLEKIVYEEAEMQLEREQAERELETMR